MKPLFLLAGLLLVGCSHTTTPLPTAPKVFPSQAVMHKAAGQAWAGLMELSQECRQDAENAFLSHNWSDAETLVGECAFLEANATIDQQMLRATFDEPGRPSHWRAEDATHVGCYLPHIMQAYTGMLIQVKEYGYLPSPKVKQGLVAIFYMRLLAQCHYKWGTMQFPYRVSAAKPPPEVQVHPFPRVPSLAQTFALREVEREEGSYTPVGETSDARLSSLR